MAKNSKPGIGGGSPSSGGWLRKNIRGGEDGILRSLKHNSIFKMGNIMPKNEEKITLGDIAG